MKTKNASAARRRLEDTWSDQKRADVYARCRALGHGWNHRTTRPILDPVREAIGTESTCPGCTTVRTKWIGTGGKLFPLVYDYPRGYLHKKTPDQPKAPAMVDYREKYFLKTLDQSDLKLKTR